MNDLDQFKELYITECYELLSDMEERLLNLTEEEDLDALNAIFRCAHSIKGGGGAFQFTALVSFTHIVEFLLDAMREGQVSATQDVVDALLQSVDVINSLVAAAHEGGTVPEENYQALAEKLKALCNAESDSETSMIDNGVEVAGGGNRTVEDGSQESLLYDISFVPNDRLFASGNEPLLILRELQRVGEVTPVVHMDKVPSLDALDTEQCYLSWDIELSSGRPEEDVREVFEFVEDDCDLKIEAFGGLLGDALPPEEEETAFGLFDDAMEEIVQARGGSAGVPETISSEQEQASLPAPPANDEKQVMPAAKTPAVTSVRVDISKIDVLVNMVGELVITQAMIAQQVQGLPAEGFHGIIEGVEDLSRHMRDLQEAVMAVRMQPVKSIFSRLPRIVRDLSRKLGKNIEIEMSGENTEIDKTVIEQLSDPLTHMIRNSIDHGIETPEERVKAGKDAQGTVWLSADNSGGRIIIEIRDDGRGIDRERVLNKAKEKGVVSGDAQLTDEDIDNLIFHPGFSTAQEVTDVSGRGVGMDVVRRNIAELGGSIELENHPGKGTKFVVSLPLTLAILDGMIVRVAGEKYIIPINNIIESLKPEAGAIQKVSGGSDVLNVRGEFIPIVYLQRVFEVTRNAKSPGDFLVVMVESGRDKYGLVVDDILGQQQVVIKSIEENADPVDGISGATILGDGNVALILDLARLAQIPTKTGNIELQAA